MVYRRIQVQEQDLCFRLAKTRGKKTKATTTKRLRKAPSLKFSSKTYDIQLMGE